MSLISIRNVSKTYYTGGVATKALQDISLEIEEGEFVSIMGQSGSGKSTLLHILGFLDAHTEGEYLLEGKLSTEYSNEEVARVRNEKFGFVFQFFNLLPRLSVIENIKVPLMYSKVPDSEWDMRARDAIEAVGLLNRMHHPATALSGGEKQRVAIARALVLNPKVIFADEPTGNLDSASGKVVMDILADLNEKRGHTVLLITHETNTARYARRIIRVHDGRLASDEVVTNTNKVDILK